MAGRIELIGHRGAPTEFHENTLDAFERAFERGADAIELDVHASSDGIVVIHHDPHLHRDVDPAAARGRALAEMSWDEIRLVRLAGGARIPALSNVLSVVPSGATVYVELKGKAIEPLVARVVMDSQRRCAVHSFDHSAIARMLNIAPDIPRGLLFDEYPRDLAGSMESAAATALWLERRLPDRRLVDAAHRLGARVYAWTVNDPADASRLAGLGVDALCSDDVRPLAYLK